MPSSTNTGQELAVWFLNTLTLIKSHGETTNGAFGLIEEFIPAGFESPYHVHHLEDEAFYVIEGEMSFVSDGNWSKAGPGGYVYGPRGIPHGFRVDGTATARVLILCAPAGFEQFVIDMSEAVTDRNTPPTAPPDMGKLMELAAKYQIDILGPLPA